MSKNKKNTNDSSESLTLKSIYNDNTVNIFTDASTDGKNKNGCYGTMAVCRDSIIDQNYFVMTNVNNYTLEALAIRNALLMAAFIKRANYKKIQCINIYTDALSVIDAIFSRHYSTSYNKELDKYQLYNNSSEKFAASADIINDCIIILREMKSLPNFKINILWVRSHLYDNLNNKNLEESIEAFVNKNRIVNSIPTVNYIMYISKYNANVDMVSRNYITEMRFIHNSNIPKHTRSPLHFIPKNTPTEFYDKRKEVKF